MQKDSKLFDDITKFGGAAMGSLLDIKREIEAVISAQLEKTLLKMHLVTKEEYEVTREIVIKAREENEKLEKRIAELEQRLNKLAPR